MDVIPDYCKLAENRLQQDVLPLEACDNAPNESSSPAAGGGSGGAQPKGTNEK